MFPVDAQVESLRLGALTLMARALLEARLAGTLKECILESRIWTEPLNKLALLEE